MTFTSPSYISTHWKDGMKATMMITLRMRCIHVVSFEATSSLGQA